MKSRKAFLALLLFALTLMPRLSSLDSFVTIDEPFWLSVGANYYYALGQREFENTVYEYHPAVTTMSFVTAAFLVDFPEYRGLGQGYFDVDKEKFDPFLIEHGHDPMYLLYLSRLFQVLVIVIFALIIFYLLCQFLRDEWAFFVTTFVSSAPYFLGHSRVLSHEAMVAFFVISSILGMFAHLEYGRKWHHLVISAVSAALAQLTKSSAMALFPVIGLMLVVSMVGNHKERGYTSALIGLLKTLGQWLAVLGITYFVLWPGMWVAPGKMLYEVYGNAFSYAFQGSRLQVTHELTPSRFALDAMGGSIMGFMEQILRRQTPLAWLGMIFAVAVFFISVKNDSFAAVKRLIAYLALSALMFILLFSAAQGRNSPHYVMASHVSMDTMAALGWYALFTWLAAKWQAASRSWVQAGSVTVLIVFQWMSALSFYPYYYTYTNPIVWMLAQQKPGSDYGEGFEQAAAYLANKPGSEAITAFAFRGRGPFSYFFPGRTILLNPLFMDEPGMGSVLERLAQSDYLVINDGLGPRNERTMLFVQALENVAPEHIIQIKGVQPIRIYRVADLPLSFYEAISQ